MDEVGLLSRCPEPPTRASAVAKAWAVENDDAVCSSQLLGDSTRVVVVPGDHVAMQQNHRTSCAAIAVVQPGPTDLKEGTGGWVPPLSQTRDRLVHKR